MVVGIGAELVCETAPQLGVQQLVFLDEAGGGVQRAGKAEGAGLQRKEPVGGEAGCVGGGAGGQLTIILSC